MLAYKKNVGYSQMMNKKYVLILFTLVLEYFQIYFIIIIGNNNDNSFVSLSLFLSTLSSF